MENLSPWVGIAGLFVTIFMAGLGLAFQLGRLSQRVTSIERTTEKADDYHDVVVRLEAEMKHAVSKLDSLDRGVGDLGRQMLMIAAAGTGPAGKQGVRGRRGLMAGGDESQ